MTDRKVELRFATTDEDRAAIYRLRYELHVEQQGLFRDEADHERRWLTDALDVHAHLLLAEAAGEVIGTLRLATALGAPFTEEIRRIHDMDRFRGVVHELDIAVATPLLLREEHRGGDLACRCMARMLAFAAEQEIELILGNCEPHLVNDSLKLGFRSYGGLYNDSTSGVLVRLAMVVGDLEHLRKVGSPLLSMPGVEDRAAPRDRIERIGAALAVDMAARSKLEMGTVEYVGEVSEPLRDGERLCGILDALSLPEARVLLDMSLILTCNKGDAILRTGHVSPTLYMLLSGSLEVHDEEGLVATIEERGTLVGEVAFFSPGGRIGDVIAGEGGARVLALSEHVLRELISSHGPVAAKLLHFVARGLAEKLRAQMSAKKRGG